MNDIENSRNLNSKKHNNNFSSDNDDIIHQLSQITSNDDKSFESSLISKNIPTLYDINNCSKEINTNLSKRNNNYGEIKNLKKNIDEENILINNKYFPLNQKLKYLCSLIQIYNINIKKYDDLKEFNKFFSNDILKPNQLEPINILFDIISELIFYIQRENKNNGMLMKEIKISKDKRNEQENIINKLKLIIKEKEKELEEITPLKNDDCFNYEEKQKEINELKNENNKLYKKINSYKLQIKNLESNYPIKNQLESSNSNINSFNNTLTNGLNNHKNIFNLYTLNNSYDNSRINLTKKSLSKEKNNIGVCFGKTTERRNRYINFNQSFSPLKTINNELYTKNNRNDNKENNNYNKNIKDGSIVINLKILLKEINKMLNVYNSSLEKININNNDNGNDNIKCIYDFVNEMNNKLKNMENFNEIDKDKKQAVYKKSIQVNTSKWKFRKKSSNKNKFKKINDNLNQIINMKRKNTSSSLRKDYMFNKFLN